MRERQPFGGPLLVSFDDGRSEQAIGGRLARAMRVQVDRELVLDDRGERVRRERIVGEPAAASRDSDRTGGAGREEVSA